MQIDFWNEIKEYVIKILEPRKNVAITVISIIQLLHIFLEIKFCFVNLLKIIDACQNAYDKCLRVPINIKTL